MARRACIPCIALLGLFVSPATGEDPKGGWAAAWDPASLGATPTPAAYPLPHPGGLAMSRRVAGVIAEHTDPGGAMQPYDLAPARAKGARMKMVPVPGGEFVMGSPGNDEGPPRPVRVAPFWMSATEVPWRIYLPFLYNGQSRKPDGTLGVPRPDSPLVDVVSQPTQPYRHYLLAGFQAGDNFPAMNMTHHAASKFCEWLSAQTGQFYRLPTEAEWEYACRAGSTTAYPFGEEPAALADYAWFTDNAGDTYHECGRRKPNAWGLHDMHGNVAEWVLDGFDPGFREGLKPGAFNPWRIPEKRYPRVIKGGSWEDEAADLRCAARQRSSNSLKALDPSFPKSIWTHTSGQHIGFRIVRPRTTPTGEEMHLFWNTDWWDTARNVEDL